MKPLVAIACADLNVEMGGADTVVSGFHWLSCSALKGRRAGKKGPMGE